VSNLSLETQRERCADFARGRGWIVAAVFVEEGESAKTADRGELKRLLHYCRAHRGHVHYVLVYALNRLARNTQDHLVLRGILGGMGIQLRSVTEPVEEAPLAASSRRCWRRSRSSTTTSEPNGLWQECVRQLRVDAGRTSRRLGIATLATPQGSRRSSSTPSGHPLVRQAFEWAAAGLSQREIPWCQRPSSEPPRPGWLART